MRAISGKQGPAEEASVDAASTPALSQSTRLTGICRCCAIRLIDRTTDAALSKSALHLRFWIPMRIKFKYRIPIGVRLTQINSSQEGQCLRHLLSLRGPFLFGRSGSRSYRSLEGLQAPSLYSAATRNPRKASMRFAANAHGRHFADVADNWRDFCFRPKNEPASREGGWGPV